MGKHFDIDDFVTGAALDLNAICRDDNCDIIGIHPKHEVVASGEADTHKAPCACPRHGETLREIVYNHVPTRRCALAHEILDDVRNDYGFVLDRTLYRVLDELVERRRIANVSPGLDSKGRPKPGGYVRLDSKLLWNGEFGYLLESLEDAQPIGRAW